jgi:HSP20 family molecular chaperone IbpA
MAKNKNNGKQEMEVQTQEEISEENMERTRSRRCFIPKADIYETEEEIVVTVDVPGANENSVDITLEKNVLTINAYIEPVQSGGYTLTYAEYEEGDYQRSFRLSDEIDRDNIKAVVNNGVLRLHLPKGESAKSRKIAVVAA